MTEIKEIDKEIEEIKKELNSLYFSLFEVENSEIKTRAKTTTKKLIDNGITDYLKEKIFDNGKPTTVTTVNPRKKGEPLVQGTNTFYFREEKQILEHLREVGELKTQNLVIKFGITSPTATNAIKQLIELGHAVQVKGRPLTVKGI